MSEEKEELKKENKNNYRNYQYPKDSKIRKQSFEVVLIGKDFLIRTDRKKWSTNFIVILRLKHNYILMRYSTS